MDENTDVEPLNPTPTAPCQLRGKGVPRCQATRHDLAKPHRPLGNQPSVPTPQDAKQSPTPFHLFVLLSSDHQIIIFKCFLTLSCLGQLNLFKPSETWDDFPTYIRYVRRPRRLSVRRRCNARLTVQCRVPGSIQTGRFPDGGLGCACFCPTATTTRRRVPSNGTVGLRYISQYSLV